jgi:hypothetical protein
MGDDADYPETLAHGVAVQPGSEVDELADREVGQPRVEVEIGGRARRSPSVTASPACLTRRIRFALALKPGLSVKRATDILWFYLGRGAWHLLVSDRRWSWDDAERWLTEQVCAALIDPR